MASQEHAADRRVLVLCAHGINDPLVSTLMLDYVLRLQTGGSVGRIMLVTEEHDASRASPEMISRMKHAGIAWRALRYDVHGWQVIQRMRNLVLLLWHAWRFMGFGRQRVVVGFLSFAGSYATVLRALVRARMVIVNFEPHSRYMIEGGTWRPGSLKARLTQWFERRQVARADAIIAPSEAVMEMVLEQRSRAPVRLQGVTIDADSYARDDEAGNRVRGQLGLVDRYIILYIGKFRDLYYSEAEYLRFMHESLAAVPDAHHMIITQDVHAEAFRSHAQWAALSDRCTVIPPMPPAALIPYLSAADLGVVAVPPTPSQRFRSPVKSAMYWAAGLPILIARGVSDDWKVAESEGVGVVLPDLLGAEAGRLRQGIDALRAQPRESLRLRCADTARRLRDTSLMVDLLREAITAGFGPADGHAGS